MKPIVLDASVTLSWCFEDEASAYSDAVLTAIRKHSALVPPLWLSEVSNGLLTATQRKRIDLDGSLTFLEKVSRLPIRIANLTSRDHFSKVFPLAVEEDLSIYDANYLFLAMREKCPLATLDSALKNAARRKKLPRMNS